MNVRLDKFISDEIQPMSKHPLFRTWPVYFDWIVLRGTHVQYIPKLTQGIGTDILTRWATNSIQYPFYYKEDRYGVGGTFRFTNIQDAILCRMRF